MSLDKAKPEDIENLIVIMKAALNPGNLSEQQKAEVDLVTLVRRAFNSDTALRRIADLSELKDVHHNQAEVFAAGLLANLAEYGITPFDNRISQLFARQIIAHWIHMFETYLRQGEV